MSERDLTAAFSSKIGETVVGVHLLCQIEFPSGTQRFWTGQGDLSWDSQTWQGTGNLINFSSLSETTDGSAQGIKIDVSAIDSADVSDFIDDEWQNSDVTIWLALKDGDSLVDDPYQYFKGKLDSAELVDTGESSTVSFGAESRLVNQVKRVSWRYTDQDQQRLFSGDKGLEFVASIQDKKIVWRNS